MTGQYVVQGIFALAGVVALLAALLNWEWFFSALNAQSVVRYAGRRKARLFYGILGLVLIGMSIFFFIKTQEAMM